jgi:Tol biopolymer transport system component
MRVDIVTPQAPEPMSFALSPDGRWLVFVAEADGNSRLWVRALAEPTARTLPGTEGALLPFWSPDNRSIGFFAGGTLKRIDISGGGPRTLVNAAPGFGGTWNEDGVILFASTSTTALFRVSANGGGEAVGQTRLDPPRQVGHGFPVFLPGGREFLFYARGSSQGIYLGSLDSPETTRLIDTDLPPFGYLPTGWLLYVQQGTLMARRFDRDARSLIGDPVAIADSLAFGAGSATTYGPAAFSPSSSGLLAYRVGGAARTQLTWFDRSGKALGTLGAPDDKGLFNPELSPNDRQAAVRRTVEGVTDIFLMDGLRAVRRTFDDTGDSYPVWSPDGNWLAFSSLRKGVADVYRKRSNGNGPDEALVETPRQKNVDDWSPDGRFVLYNEEDPATGRDLWLLPLDPNGKPGKPTVFLKTPSQEHRGQFSPDGRFIAYVSNESGGRHEVFVLPFPRGASGQSQISTNGGIHPRWSQDGRELYYVAPDGKLIATPMTVKGGAIEPGTPKELFQTRMPGGGTNAYTRPQYDVSKDGRFLVNATIEEGVTPPITLVINWNPPED